MNGFSYYREFSLEKFGVESVLVAVIGAGVGETLAHESGHLMGDLQDIEDVDGQPESPHDVNLMFHGPTRTRIAHKLDDGMRHPDFSGPQGAPPGPEILEDQVKKSREGLQKYKESHR